MDEAWILCGVWCLVLTKEVAKVRAAFWDGSAGREPLWWHWWESPAPALAHATYIVSNTRHK